MVRKKTRKRKSRKKYNINNCSRYKILTKKDCEECVKKGGRPYSSYLGFNCTVKYKTTPRKYKRKKNTLEEYKRKEKISRRI